MRRNYLNRWQLIALDIACGPLDQAFDGGSISSGHASREFAGLATVEEPGCEPVQFGLLVEPHS